MSSFSYQPDKLLEEFRHFKATLATRGIVSDKHDDEGKKTKIRLSSSFVVASVQFTSSEIPTNNLSEFWTLAERSIRSAAGMGADLILLPELFLGPYFCQSRQVSFMEMAWENVEGCWIVQQMQILAKEYSVVLPVSLYERENNALYNTVVMIDADGTVLGKYRKSHIPDGPGYQEKFYFSPGDTGFKVWDTSVGKVGVAICWDQWFPEVARSMALLGAEILLYPTAIGSEPQDPTIDSSDHWQRTMQGHAAANVSQVIITVVMGLGTGWGRGLLVHDTWKSQTDGVFLNMCVYSFLSLFWYVVLYVSYIFQMVPVVASNRQGTEILLDANGQEKQRITFYGRSFITDETGKLVAQAPDGKSTNGSSSSEPFTILTSTINPAANRAARLPWGLFRDRRPDLYKILLNKDGNDDR